MGRVKSQLFGSSEANGNDTQKKNWFSIEFSDCGANIVLQLSLRSLSGRTI